MRGSLYDWANIIFRAKRFCDRFIYGRVIIAEQKVLKSQWLKIGGKFGMVFFVCLFVNTIYQKLLKIRDNIIPSNDMPANHFNTHINGGHPYELVVLLRVRNFKVWSHLKFSGWKANIFAHISLADPDLQVKRGRSNLVPRSPTAHFSV